MTGLAYYHSSDDVQMKPVPEWLPVSVGLQTRHIVNSAGDVEGGEEWRSVKDDYWH